MKAHNNPDLFHRMTEPFPDKEAVTAAVDGFVDQVRAARERHRIMNVLMVIEVAGPEGPLVTQFSFGDTLQAEVLAAYALGSARQDREALIARAMKGQYGQ